MSHAIAPSTKESRARAAIRSSPDTADNLSRLISTLILNLEALSPKERQKVADTLRELSGAAARNSTEEQRATPVSCSYLRIKDVLTRTGLKRSTLYNKIASGSFPTQVKLAQNCVGWREDQIDDWCSCPQ
ncbi:MULTISPECIES: helix-turn-helix transcriptional regulator [unclassified Sphingobium]|uniref:helix-turn-helix transcriptional regulator n=1 Tax=unclassified Sphingobium TaxID=2611147 RepID=UPI0009E80524|nr:MULTISPECIES: AlpA family phage regulatory protein [unclassified Sphingobium]